MCVSLPTVSGCFRIDSGQPLQVIARPLYKAWFIDDDVQLLQANGDRERWRSDRYELAPQPSAFPTPTYDPKHRLATSKDHWTLRVQEREPFAELRSPSGKSISPQWVGMMGNVKRLSLWGNPITDEGLAQLATLWSLEVLDVHDTAVTADGLNHLWLLENLRTLIVPDSVELAQLDRLSRLTNLEIIRRGTND